MEGKSGDYKDESGEDSNVSRRAAIVAIGQAATGFGLSTSILADTKNTLELPPGIYQASRDHLGHALMSVGRFHPIPPGCPTDYIRPRMEPFTPLFFSPADFAVVRRLTELVLGGNGSSVQEVAEWVDLRVAIATDVREAARRLNPLHRTLAVAYFGSAQVVQLETADPEKICREGLEWLSNAARSRGSDQFLSLTSEQQIAILTSVSDERADKERKNSGTRFFAFFKTEVIRGYYTSQPGLKELDFKGNGFYTRSPGCHLKV
ncbi:MAG: gluconate 2-dehydrogenase subunit 3 family protein [Bryobacteraceae bacterium]